MKVFVVLAYSNAVHGCDERTVTQRSKLLFKGLDHRGIEGVMTNIKNM